MNKESEKKIYVAGHKGMVGSAIVTSLKKKVSIIYYWPAKKS